MHCLIVLASSDSEAFAEMTLRLRPSMGIHGLSHIPAGGQALRHQHLEDGILLARKNLFIGRIYYV